MTVGAYDVAFPHGIDPAVHARALNRAHDRFVESGAVWSRMRPLVIESWMRSLSEGVDPESSTARIDLDGDEVRAAQDAHPLSPVMPVVRRLLVDSAAEAGLLVAVSDAAGRLLWVEGSSSLRSRAEAMAFHTGANWSEASAGTNAPGTALALDRPVQIFGAEHLSRPVTPWSCSAAPIHDPDTGAMLGVLDLTGGPEVAAPQSLALVRATVAAVEAELRLARLSSVQLPSAVVSRDRPELRVLGERGAHVLDGSAARRLGLRHSEILLLLASAPAGLSAAEVAAGLSGDGFADVTIRAEMSRFRAAIAPWELASRPYRLGAEVVADVGAVREDLRAGRLRSAVAGYRGPILPLSHAPAIVAMRDELHREVRVALLASGDPDALLTFADTPHGRHDREVWAAALCALPPGSPRAAQVRAHLDAG